MSQQTKDRILSTLELIVEVLGIIIVLAPLFRRKSK